jgi:predicted thioesterase
MVVAAEHLASRFKDPTLPPVLATPLMILFMENAAPDAIREYLTPGESALGTVINIRHPRGDAGRAGAGLGVGGGQQQRDNGNPCHGQRS